MLALANECLVAIYGWTGSTRGVLPTPLTFLKRRLDRELKKLHNISSLNCDAPS
jgi:hypothetical protein